MRIDFVVAVLLVAATTSLAGQEATLQRTANNGNVVLEGVPEVSGRIEAQLNRYQNVRGAGFADWTVDGRGIYVVTRFAEVSQIHRVDMPGGARRQLTFFKEPVSGLTRRPQSAQVIFRMDEGGSEFYQLFLLDPVSGEHVRLTDGQSRNGAAVWSDDGRRIAYQSTRRNGRSNDVWMMDVSDTASARLVFEAPDGSWWGPADWSPTGDRLLIVQYVSVNDSRIHLLDVETGTAERIAGDPQKPASWVGIAPVFSPDGRGVFLSSDVDGQFEQLAYLDLSSRRLHPITADIPWNVEGFDLSEDGTKAAFVTNEDGTSRLYLMDPSSRRYRRVDAVPTGLIFGLEFSPDGGQLGMTLNTASTPSDAFTLALDDTPMSHGELTRWTFSEVGGLNTAQFVTPELIHYPTFDSVAGQSRTIPAYVYRPKTRGPHPVIVSIHGGPEGQYRPGFSSTYQLWLGELGAAVIAPNVRGSAGYGKDYLKMDNGYLRENSVRDIGALLDWIATQPDLDENRVAVYGGSYGGYMVLSSAFHYSDRLAAAVDIVGISNFVTFLENTQAYRRDLRRVEYGDERIPEMRAFLDSISPNRHADKIQIPLFVAQGQNDPRVPVTESDQMVQVIRENGRDVWYMKALNEGHGFRKKENRDLFNQIVVMFFAEHLVGGEAVSAR